MLLKDIRILHLRFICQCLSETRFSHSDKNNIFRGAFGNIAMSEYNRSGNVLYKNIFKPGCNVAAPSGLRDMPRPFVLISPDDNYSVYGQNHLFELGINVFGNYCEVSSCFVDIVHRMGAYGIGSNLAKFSVIKVMSEYPSVEPVPAGNKIKLVFATPALIKDRGSKAKDLSFSVIFKRLRDRINSIALFYEGGHLNYDNKSLGDLSERVKTVSSEWTYKHIYRTAGSGERQSIGGITGCGVYGFPSPEIMRLFYPWLAVGEYTNVGKNTVWGMGRFKLSIAD